jgi:lipopolysaccharide transport system permease protein
VGSDVRHDDGRPEVVLRPAALSLGHLGRSLARLSSHRELFIVLTLHRLRVRYRQSLLGPLWAILQPLAMMTIFVVVFSLLAPVSSVAHPYPVFAYSGLLPWTAFASAIVGGAASLTSHAALVTRVHFPREILPVTYVAAALVDLLAAALVLIAMLAYYDIGLTAAALWAIPALAVLAVWATGVSLVLAGINVYYRDIGVAMPLLLQFWMFASPVIYPLSAVPAGWRPVYLANPMAGIVDTFRRAVLEGAPPDRTAMTAATVIAVAFLPLAYGWFKYVDSTMADRV